MKPMTQTSPLRRAAFTLIELLVVIAVIAILAALIFPVTAGIKRKRLIAVAQAEMQNVETAIESYRTRRGTYPPDNPNSYLINQLYFELKGTVRSATGDFDTLDGSGKILAADFIPVFFNTPKPVIQGFVNSSASAKGDDEKAAAEAFLKNLKPNQSGAPDKNLPMVKVLACSVSVEEPASYPIPLSKTDVPGLNPWRYVSSTPTNNPASYDLWVDLFIGGKTNRICNWSKTPLINP